VSAVVRPMTPADLPFLWEMSAAAAHAPNVAAVQSNPALVRYLDEWGRADDVALIAWAGEPERRAGAIWMRLFPATDPGFGYYDERTPEMGLAVVENCRRAGVGRLLLTHLLGLAAARYPGVTLAVFESNQAAIRLYESMGFMKFGEYPNSRGDVSWKMRVAFDSPGPAVREKTGENRSALHRP